MERYLKSKGANEKVIESLSNQLPENDPDFDFLFAFTLRQMNLNKIENFLIHQEIIYQNRANYLKFLSILLIDYKGIIPKKVRRITNEWIQGTIMRLRQSKKSKITAATITNSKINNKKTIVEPLPAGWVRIPCKIDIEKIKKYFSFFCSETGGSKDEISFISKEDIDKLFKYGLAYPIDEPKEKRITFNKSQKRPWGILYYFTFKLYQKNCPNNLTLEEKMHYAKFLKHNVQGIGISLKSLNQSLRESASGSLKNNKFQKYYKELG